MPDVPGGDAPDDDAPNDGTAREEEVHDDEGEDGQGHGGGAENDDEDGDEDGERHASLDCRLLPRVVEDELTEHETQRLLAMYRTMFWGHNDAEVRASRGCISAEH